MVRLLRSFGLVCLVLPACGAERRAAASSAPVVSTSSGQRAALALPRARRHEPLVDAPLVTVRGAEVLVDGRAVASTEPILASGRVQTIEGELVALKAQRESFRIQHPDQPFSGVVLLELEASTRGAVLLSVFQTAAFSGYPYVGFVVEPLEAPSTRAQARVDVWVPAPQSSPADGEARLLVDASTPNAVVRGWVTGADDSGSASPYPDPRSLADRVSEEWKAHGRHRAPEDPRSDQAILEVGAESVLSDVIAALDAIRTPEREQTQGGVRAKVPAFQVTLRAKGFAVAR